MALRGAEMGLVMALVMMLWTGASAQLGCMSAIISLSPCLNYVTGNSPTPSSSCCTQLASVVSSQVQCLCTVLNGGSSSLGITINQTQALALPAACNVQTPPVSQCNASPAEGPASLTTPSTPSMPEAPSTTPSIPSSGSKTASTAGGQSSDASSMALPPSLMVILTLIASVASAITVY